MENSSPESHMIQTSLDQKLPSQIIEQPRLLESLGENQEILRRTEDLSLNNILLLSKEFQNLSPSERDIRTTEVFNDGINHYSTYQRTGAVEDLNASICKFKISLSFTRVESEEYNYRHFMLGHGLQQRFYRTRESDDLRQAIHFFRSAASLSQLSDPANYPQYYHAVGAGYYDRYQLLEDADDLDSAVRIFDECLQITDASNPYYLHSSGNAYTAKYRRTKSREDLDRAVVNLKTSIDNTSSNDPHLIFRLCGLGIGRYEQYQETSRSEYLDEAIRMFQKSIDKSETDQQPFVDAVHWIGVGYHCRYHRTGAREDLDTSIRHSQKYLDETPLDHPKRAEGLYALGDRLRERYEKTQAKEDLNAITQTLQQCLEYSTSSVLHRLLASKKLLAAYAEAHEWQKAYQAARTAVSLIPSVAERSLKNVDKQYRLSYVAGLASDAAAISLNAEKDPFDALQLLELGRGTMTRHLDEIRTDIKNLEVDHPGLADQFLEYHDDLISFDSSSRISTSKESNSWMPGGFFENDWKNPTNRRIFASEAIGDLVHDIRKLAGYDDFLLAPSSADVQATAKYGPIVIVNVSQYRCDALIIEHHRIRSLKLTELSIKQIKDFRKGAQGDNLGSAVILEWLWDVITRPVLDILGFLCSASNENVPHVWWIPTGLLSRFPLHAAGYHTNGSLDTVLDKVMSSFASSITALIHSRRRPLTPITSSKAKVLLVAMEHTLGHSRLPFAREEVKILRSLCKSVALDPIEPGTYQKDIMKHLRECKIFHFAGHGHTDDVDPIKSYLLPEDWKDSPLKVDDLLRINIREHSPFLAFLSACGTGQIRQDRLVDENIHLISACQLAGFRHVIGTLWEVDDETCVDMAKITYEGMINGDFKDESVCRGLHRAAKELRNRWLSTQANTGRGNKLGAETEIPTERNETEEQAASVSNQGHGQFLRDVILCDDDDDEFSRVPYVWVPYVHFGP